MRTPIRGETHLNVAHSSLLLVKVLVPIVSQQGINEEASSHNYVVPQRFQTSLHPTVVYSVLAYNHKMSSSLSILLASAAMAVAQTTTLDILFPVEGIKTMYGAVVDANPEVTTFALHCGEHVENVQCHILGTQTVVQGPSTLSIQYSFAGDKEAGYL